MPNKIYKFSEFDDFYIFFKPLTPAGKLFKEKKIIFNDIKTLDKEYALVNEFISCVQKDTILFDRIENHLSDIPFLSLDSNSYTEISDVFLLKKFLSRTKAIFNLLPKKLTQTLKTQWSSDELLSLLMKGGKSDAFYISDSYDKELKKTRTEVIKISHKLNKIKNDKLKEITKLGLDFSLRDFLIVNAASGDKYYKNKDLFIEAYDSENIIVKPVFGECFLKLSAEKEILNRKEKAIENNIIKNIISLAKKNLKTLVGYANAIERADILIAKARLSIKFNMVRPVFTKNAATIFRKARFIPIELQLKKMKLKYTPLSASFPKRISSIRGSNMGGKTVVLKTAAFFQLSAQMGFFVPAEYYQTQVFKKISFAGNLSDEDTDGLSGFGLEMRGFIDSSNLSEKSLIFMDEFAKTTNSSEATALLSAIIEIFSNNPNAFMFISTHFSGLPENKNAVALKMKGFDNTAFEKHFKPQKTSLTEKLKMINKFMRYEIVKDDNKKRICDAIKIAKILGMNAKIIQLAKKNMEKKYG
jgi:DNA mismatch repair protein MutS2